jgi:hypothetical protein
MERFAFLHPEARATARQKTWEACQEVVHKLLAEINNQVFDGEGEVSPRDFDGNRRGLQLVCGEPVPDPPPITILVHISYTPHVLEVSAEGHGCVAGEWEAACYGAKDLDAGDRLVDALKEAIQHLEPAIVSMADRR